MGPPSYMWSVIDRNIVMRRIPVHIFCEDIGPFLDQCAGNCEKMALKVITWTKSHPHIVFLRGPASLDLTILTHPPDLCPEDGGIILPQNVDDTRCRHARTGATSTSCPGLTRINFVCRKNLTWLKSAKMLQNYLTGFCAPRLWFLIL